MLDELYCKLSIVADEHNNTPVERFENYSANEMHEIIHFLDIKSSPLQLNKLTNDQYLKSPLFCQINYLLTLLTETDEIKLTTTGALPPKIVKEMYLLGVPDYFIESGPKNLIKEVDCLTVQFSRILLEVSHLVKVRNNKLSLVKKNQSIISDSTKLFEHIFISSVQQLNWTYFDGYDDYNNIGQDCLGFTLVLLSKYGSKQRDESYYTQKYMYAFPDFLENDDDEEEDADYFHIAKRYAAYAYSVRTFERYLLFFGLVTIERNQTLLSNSIQKTALFDQLFSLFPPVMNKKYNA